MLQADDGFIFESTKTYVHSVGLSCSFRQWRAEHSHCRFLHGYALEVKLTFRGEPDNCGWVQDFGGLKEVKEYLEGYFDHKTVVAQDDPMFHCFVHLFDLKLIDMITLPHVGCEAFAKHIFNMVTNLGFDKLRAVEVREHAGNSATYRRLP